MLYFYADYFQGIQGKGSEDYFKVNFCDAIPLFCIKILSITNINIQSHFKLPRFVYFYFNKINMLFSFSFLFYIIPDFSGGLSKWT